MTTITVIILTRDEALHIKRAIASVAGFASRIVVVDSGSADDTVAQARAAGAEVLEHPWRNYADQFNWALDQIAGCGGWVLRLDADEIVEPDLAGAIRAGLPDVAGLIVTRRITFQGQPVRFGGVGAVPSLRLFREGQGRCENRWMDEHIEVTGRVAALHGSICDDNRKGLDWWMAKHVGYANREVVDLMARASEGSGLSGRPAVVRWIKQHFYRKLPSGWRAGVYFVYRYVLRGGFLDRAEARHFHVLQGFWYRYLVDTKMAEVVRYMKETGAPRRRAIREVLGIDIGSDREARP
ncbi:glycosyltransferase family 2 protein [Yoonia litorea]|uniref:Glycosyltransferase involved in cell wall bisynthesis n=1 Tax=Yoonia litorea TaxID=1123755 RepID=A0A1I6LE17_9RHOB|nr:glycosyltransferase family 2 protein [Yoonia litorea]SFS01644.1 Glycosyltransferase involved in cell wall bisynthesis [Yoonia litorea]